MISLKIQKCGNARYISHIDLLRNVKKILRRAGISVEYSQGFNPHMLLNLSQPLPLGIASKAEWVQIHTENKDTEGIVKFFNENCPKGFEAIKAFYSEKKPNIAGKVVASDYYIYCPKAFEMKNELHNIAEKPYTIEYKKKDKTIKKQANEYIYKISVDENGISLRLAFGNVNLRIDRLVEKLNKDFSLDIKHKDITRISQLVLENGNYIGVEEYLKGMK